MGLFDLFRRRRPVTGPPTYRNSAVVDQIAREERVDRETADRWFQEMLVFLDLSNSEGKALSPPVPVDKAWHAFVLHTRDYESYCRERFGRVIHHEPAGEPDPKAYRRAYEARSGWRHDSVDPGIWVVPAAVSSSASADSPPQAVDSGHDVGQAVSDTASDHNVDFGQDPGGSSDSGGSTDSGGSSDSGGGGDSGGGSSCGSSCGSSS